MSKYDFDYNLKQYATAMIWFGKSVSYSREYRMKASNMRLYGHRGITPCDYYWNIEQAVYWRKQAVQWLKISKLHSARLSELHEGAYYDGMSSVA